MELVSRRFINYQWKSKYSGLDVNQLKRVKEREAEVSQYKKLVAELTLDNRILKDPMTVNRHFH